MSYAFGVVNKHGEIKPGMLYSINLCFQKTI